MKKSCAYNIQVFVIKKPFCSENVSDFLHEANYILYQIEMLFSPKCSKNIIIPANRHNTSFVCSFRHIGNKLA